jgi:hypothetical protein
MSKGPETEYDSRYRSKSDNPKETVLSKYPKITFKVTGQLILDGTLERKNIETALESEPSSLQNMKNSMAASKLTKMSDFVQLPKIKFDDRAPPPAHFFYSQDTIPPARTPGKATGTSFPAEPVEK